MRGNTWTLGKRDDGIQFTVWPTEPLSRESALRMAALIVELLDAETEFPAVVADVRSKRS